MVEVLNNPKYKTVYISGPITGIENGNKQAFSNYEEKLKIQGFNVINPHNLHTEEEEKTFTWVQFMKSDIKALMDCDFVAVLNGWANSKGANVEVMLARTLNMPIVDAETLNELF